MGAEKHKEEHLLRFLLLSLADYVKAKWPERRRHRSTLARNLMIAN